MQIEVVKTKDTSSGKWAVLADSNGGDKLTGAYLSQELFSKLQAGETIELSLASTEADS